MTVSCPEMNVQHFPFLLSSSGNYTRL